ncbi:MAG TPA: hypothetical protein VIG46_13635 [Candidatus Baltobacteraceae bacterium]|jgi:hypothetical protein
MLAFIDVPILIGLAVILVVAVAIPIGLAIYFVRASHRREIGR